MTPTEQRANATAVAERGPAESTLATTEDCAEFLELVPALSTCTRNVLKEFVAYGVIKVHCPAGDVLRSLTQHDQNLYVLAAGSALLDAGDEVAISLEPGDYFGKGSGRRHQLNATVIAVSDIEVLVINPREISWLGQASSRERHPSEIDWRTPLPTTMQRAARRSHRRAVLSG